MFLEISQNSLENHSTRNLIKLQVPGLQLVKKETLAQVFSCKFYEVSKNTFFTKHLDNWFCTLWNNLTSYPRRPFNLSSYWKQTLQSKPLGKLFSKSTINHRNSFFPVVCCGERNAFIARWGRHFKNIILVMRSFIFMKIILTFQSFNRREVKNEMDVY